MSVLILAPVLKIFKEGVQLVVWISLQVTVYADVSPVANLHHDVIQQRNAETISKVHSCYEFWHQTSAGLSTALLSSKSIVRLSIVRL